MKRMMMVCWRVMQEILMETRWRRMLRKTKNG